MFQKVLAAAAILIAASALFTSKPADTEAAPAPPDRSAEIVALQEQVATLTAELEAAKSSPVVNNPSPDNGPALEAMLVAADCANGQCNARRIAAPVRAAGRYAVAPVRYVKQAEPVRSARRRFGGADGKIRTPFR
jgi:hypothetical protein